MKVLLVLWAFLKILLSMVPIVSPRTAWKIREGWKYKHAEPEDWLLVTIRLRGVFGLIVSMVFLFVTFHLIWSF